jgi:hypothetical protein
LVVALFNYEKPFCYSRVRVLRVSCGLAGECKAEDVRPIR